MMERRFYYKSSMEKFREELKANSDVTEIRVINYSDYHQELYVVTWR